MMHDLEEMAGRIQDIHWEEMDLDSSFQHFSSRFASTPGTVVLLSGGEMDCARYHILGTRPWLRFLGRGRHMSLTIGERAIRFEADPLDTLRTILETFHLDAPGLPVPMGSGLMGYLSYDLKDHLEELPSTSMDDLDLPDICLFAPSIIVTQDRAKGRTWLCVPNRVSKGQNTLDEDVAWFKAGLHSKPSDLGPFAGGLRGFCSNFARADYMAQIVKIRDYIASGHVYQVNLSQRFQTDFEGDPFSLFLALYDANPAPFFAYIHAGDHQIVSTSPERFLMQKGQRVETRPIKGTRPRGKTESEDRALTLELEQSKKDDAELSMIVDLLRNDLGKVCERGSVRVTQHKRLETYENVYHLVSIVEGDLAVNSDSVDLLRATFPGGSITGCPKIRSMEIIDELEPNRRHVYTGSIGYVSFHDTMDLSIAIRTATICNGNILFSVGGGIVYDSDPLDEYEETLHKGKTLMGIFKKKDKGAYMREGAWVNGSIRPLDQAVIKITDLSFQYGYGFFETIRVDQGEVKYLDAHMGRFGRTWKALFDRPTPDLSWKEIIDQVIHENGLDQQTAAVKVIAAWGTRETPPFDHKVIVTARPYAPRLAGKNHQGLWLLTYPHPRHSPLADHKTLNYLYYYLAGKWAKNQGGDEALITNADGSISETHTANIFLVFGKRVIRPLSPHVLPGIMEEEVCKLLLDQGYEVEKEAVQPDGLFTADHVFVTNSLIGAVPVLGLDGKALKSSSDLCRRINHAVL
jgi:para-aminobenzoate synthetase component 1